MHGYTKVKFLNFRGTDSYNRKLHCKIFSINFRYQDFSFRYQNFKDPLQAILVIICDMGLAAVLSGPIVTANEMILESVPLPLPQRKTISH